MVVWGYFLGPFQSKPGTYFLTQKFKSKFTKNKGHAYKAIVRPSHLNQIEKAQRRAARFTCNIYHNTSSVTDMLENIDWPTLQVC